MIVISPSTLQSLRDWHATCTGDQQQPLPADYKIEPALAVQQRGQTIGYIFAGHWRKDGKLDLTVRRNDGTLQTIQGVDPLPEMEYKNVGDETQITFKVNFSQVG